MKEIILLSLLLAITQHAQAQPVTYKAGDSLNVFTIGGLKLREGASLSSRVLASMKLGDKVIVRAGFQADDKYFQTIEGFAGHWVKVKYDTLTGFAFDGFLSALPVPKEDTSLVKTRTTVQADADDPYLGQEISGTFIRYIQSEFQPVCEPVEYFNGSDGEGAHHMRIQKLSNGFTCTNNSYLESWSTELLMPKVRLSEVKNLIILLAYRSNIARNTFEQVKDAVKKVSEGESPCMKPVTGFQMFWIDIKYYPNETNEPKWALVIGGADA